MKLVRTFAAALGILAMLALPARADPPSSSEGAAPFHYLSTPSTNATNVKNSQATLFSLVAINTTGTIYYAKLYDKATAPNCNTDAVAQTFPVPASTSGAGLVLAFRPGIRFWFGLSFCITGGIADSDNSNAATGVALDLVYQ